FGKCSISSESTNSASASHSLCAEPHWVNVPQRRVADVPVQICITSGEADRVLADESAQGRVEVSRAVVVQTRLGVPFSTGELEPVSRRRVRLADDVAEAVVFDVIDQFARIVDDVADRSEVVGEVPGGLSTRAEAG